MATFQRVCRLVWADSKVPGNFKNAGPPPAIASGLTLSARKFQGDLVCDLTVANEAPACLESAELVWVDSKVPGKF